MRSPRSSKKGMALLAVIMVVALMTVAVAITLNRTEASIREGAAIRSAEMVKGGLELGVAQAMDRMQEVGITTLLDTNNDLFYNPGTAVAFVPAFSYPTVGPTTNDYQVTVGLRLGQRGRAASGENASTTYGQIVEVQVQIATNLLDPEGANLVPAEERASIGIMIPRANSHSN